MTDDYDGPDVRKLDVDEWEVWPTCSDCQTAYVHRRCMSFSPTTGQLTWRWLWQQDCKHGRKGTPQPVAILMTKDGPYEVPT